MTPTEQRIAIAEACNWEQPPPLSTLCGWKDSAGIAMLSDPLNDLNAMHEAEKTLPMENRDTKRGSQCHDYSQELWNLTAKKIDGVEGKGGVMFALAHATAAQRAEAFLRCIGRWKD